MSKDFLLLWPVEDVPEPHPPGIICKRICGLVLLECGLRYEGILTPLETNDGYGRWRRTDGRPASGRRTTGDDDG